MNTRIDSMEAYHQAYEKSVSNPHEFWSDIANEFVWKKRWDNVLNWDFKSFDVKWFEGASLNITENCLDRHLEKNADTPAIIWEPNDLNGKGLTLTYKELYQEVCKASNMLKQLGVKKGDRVCIYMPMVPEAAVAMLACARVGAIHSIVFAGFSAQSLADRINDATCKLVITADGVYRGAKVLNLKEIVDEALTNTTSVEK